MMKYLTVAGAVVAAVFAVAEPVMARDVFGAHMRGSEEVPTISTIGHGYLYASSRSVMVLLARGVLLCAFTTSGISKDKEGYLAAAARAASLVR